MLASVNVQERSFRTGAVVAINWASVSTISDEYGRIWEGMQVYSLNFEDLFERHRVRRHRAHFEFTRVNIEQTNLRKEIEDVREAGASKSISR